MTFITHLKPNQIFVFGSNLQGRHGKGAAKQALGFGAVMGVGVGLRGQTYAIPTREYNGWGWGVSSLTLDEIQRHVTQFLIFASNRPDLEFLVTPIGTGLAGYAPQAIGPFFMHSPPNVNLPPEFVPYRVLPKPFLGMAPYQGGDPPGPQEPDLIPPFTD